MKEEIPTKRKLYVEQIRRSFQEKTGEKPKELYPEEEDAAAFLGLKLRIFFSIVIFFAVLLCKQTDSTFYGISAVTLMEQIERSVTLPDDILNQL